MCVLMCMLAAFCNAVAADFMLLAPAGTGVALQIQKSIVLHGVQDA